MNRHTATHSAPASLWGDIETAVRGLGKLFSARPAAVTGLDEMEREQSRIRLSSRHWLMG